MASPGCTGRVWERDSGEDKRCLPPPQHRSEGRRRHKLNEEVSVLGGTRQRAKWPASSSASSSTGIEPQEDEERMKGGIYRPVARGGSCSAKLKERWLAKEIFTRVWMFL